MDIFVALTLACLALGWLIALVGSVWFIIETFKESAGWGLACLFIPFASLVFMIKFWDKAKGPTILSVVGCLVAIVIPQGLMSLRGGSGGSFGGRASTSSVELAPFDPATIVVPPVASLARGAPQTISPGVLRFQVELGEGRDGRYDPPGHGGRLWLYLPEGEHAAASLPCILIAPAGSRGNHGMLLTVDDEAEHTPYARAGFAVVAYELDGADASDEGPSEEAQEHFAAAMCGLVNARIAMEWALACAPEVNPHAIYAAGHSSAAAIALLVAAHEPRIAGVLAYAPASYHGRLEEDWAARLSPIDNAPRVRCPVYLFHSRQDASCPISDSEALARALEATNADVRFDAVKTGDHYKSMTEQGLPAGLSWLRQRHPNVVPPAAALEAAGGPVKAQLAGVAKLLKEASSDDPSVRAEAVAQWVRQGFDREEGARTTMLQALAGRRLDATIDRHLAKSCKGSAMTLDELLVCLPLAPPQTQAVLLERLVAIGLKLPPERIVAVLETLTDDRELHVEEALVLFGRAREGCAPRLVAARGEEWPLTDEGKRTLAALPPERVKELLASSDAQHRVLGARLLAARGAEVALETLAPLVLGDPASLVRQEVALLLEVMKDPRAAPALARALRSEKDESVRARVRRSLTVLPGVEATKALLPLLASPEVEERLAAVGGLEALASPDGIRPLAGALLDPDRRVGLAACKALEALRTSRAPGVPELVGQQAREIGKAALTTKDDELKRVARHLYFQLRGRLPEQDGLR